jgi:hypothetical protein
MMMVWALFEILVPKRPQLLNRQVVQLGVHAPTIDGALLLQWVARIQIALWRKYVDQDSEQ